MNVERTGVERETIDLNVSEHILDGPPARLRLTSGEARTLARQIVALADSIDM